MDRKYYYCTRIGFCSNRGGYVHCCYANEPQNCESAEPVPEDDLWLFEETENEEES